MGHNKVQNIKCGVQYSAKCKMQNPHITMQCLAIQHKVHNRRVELFSMQTQQRYQSCQCFQCFLCRLNKDIKSWTCRNVESAEIGTFESGSLKLKQAPPEILFFDPKTVKSQFVKCGWIHIISVFIFWFMSQWTGLRISHGTK